MPKKRKLPKNLPTSAATLPEPLRLYTIGLGDLHGEGVGAVIRVEATSEAEALRRARALANQFFPGVRLARGDDYVSGLDAVRIYLDGTEISSEHIVDVEVLD